MKPAGSDARPRRARLGPAVPLAALVVASVLWGGAVTGTKYALGGFGPVTLLSIEVVAATAALWAALVVRGCLTVGDAIGAALVGSSGCTSCSPIAAMAAPT
jgi:hypothetical protein